MRGPSLNIIKVVESAQWFLLWIVTILFPMSLRETFLIL